MNTQVRVYVGTYAKYNGGSIAGAWLDLDDYDNISEFMSACSDLHDDESDPEFMIQASEGLPDRIASREYVTQQMIDYAKLNDHDREILGAYIEYSGDDAATIDDAQDRLCGDYDSFSELVEDIKASIKNLIDKENIEIKNMFEAN